jgi:hypothetical protein
MIKLIDFKEFINEKYSLNKNIEIQIEIDDSEHSLDRKNRNDNDPDINGNKNVSSNEIKADVIKSLDQLLKKNFFSIGIWWIGNNLCKNILCKNTNTNLNIIYSVSKINKNNNYIYSIKIVTVMRKEKFNVSNLELSKTYTINI